MAAPWILSCILWATASARQLRSEILARPFRQRATTNLRWRSHGRDDDDTAHGAQEQSKQGGDYDYSDTDSGYSAALNLTTLRRHQGLVDIYTDPTNMMALFFDVTDLVQSEHPMEVLASATWAQGTFLEEEGVQLSVMHEPVDGTEDTMLIMRLSGDQSLLDIAIPRLSMRTSDKQAKNALNNGAWTGWKGSLPRVQASGAANRIIVDASKFVINGFFVEGWRFAETMVSYRVRQVKCYEKNILVNVAMQIQDQSGVVFPVVVSFSMLRLPQPRMQPRQGDDRLGFFTVDFLDIGVHEGARHKILSDEVDVPHSYIQRFNTSKKIKFYVDYSVPSRWRDYFKQGVESWNAAFERIGKPGLVEAVLPGTEDWPTDYDPNDARYSTISWSFDQTEVYALGMAKVDPRSGEIMKSDIIVTNGWVHSWLEELDLESPTVTRKSMSYRKEHRKPRERQYADVDFRGRKRGERMRKANGDGSGHATHRRKPSPFLRNRGRYSFGQYSDDKGNEEAFRVNPMTFAAAQEELTNEQWEEIIGAGLKSVVMHETGHSMGLRHNFKASTGISEECLRDKNCTQVKGLTVSCMDYIPANILQLGRGIEQPDVFSPVIGSYDKLAIQYGYGDYNYTELAAILELGGTMPMCTDEDKYGGDDPLCQVHDLGKNPLIYYRERLNLLKQEQRHLANMSVGGGESYTRYGEAALSVLQKAAYIGEMLTTFIGGITTKHVHRMYNGTHAPDKAVEIIPLEQQQEAMGMILGLLKHNTADYLPPAEFNHLLIARQGEIGTGSIDVPMEVRALRSSLLRALVSPEMLARLYASHAVNSSGYSISTLFDTLTDVAWAGDSNVSAGLESTDLDIQSMLMRYVKETYTSRCDQYIPVEVLSTLLTSLQHTKKSVQDLHASASESETNSYIETHGGESYKAYIDYMQGELSDIGKPCKPPTISTSSYSYDYY